MPSVLKYNAPATADAQVLIAEALRGGELSASEAFARFIQKLGLPSRLSDVAVLEEKFALISENAMLNMFTRTNPQPIRSPADVLEILKMAA